MFEGYQTCSEEDGTLCGQSTGYSRPKGVAAGTADLSGGTKRLDDASLGCKVRQHLYRTRRQVFSKEQASLLGAACA